MEAVVIDTALLGEHTVLYSATDNAGNVGEATRTVSVIDPNAVPTGDATVGESTTTESSTNEIIVGTTEMQ